MDKRLKKLGEKCLKSFLKKKKIGYTIALLTAFLITGTIELTASTTIIEQEIQVNTPQEVLIEDIQRQRNSIQELLDKNEVQLKKLRDNDLILLRKGDFYSKPIYPSTQIFFNFGWENSGKMKDRTIDEYSYESDILRDGNGTVIDDKRYTETLNTGANIKLAVPNVPIISKTIFIKVDIPDISLGSLPDPVINLLQAPIVNTPAPIGHINSPGTLNVNVALPGAIDSVTISLPQVVAPIIPIVETKSVNIPSTPQIDPIMVTTPTPVIVEFINGNYQADYYWHGQNPNSFNSSGIGSVTLSNIPSGSTTSENGYIGFWGATASVIIPQNITVNGSPSRGIIIDEMIHNTTYTTTGIITLNKEKNIGIDLQGTHRTTGTNSGSWANPVISDVINEGTILGAGLSEQLGIGFNNFDRSYDGTLTIIHNTGNIIMNGDGSLGVQLKPEDPNGSHVDGDNVSGKVLMRAINESSGKITMNGDSSFALSTVGWKGTSGEFGKHSDPDYVSGLFNEGTISINGKESIGIALLYSIQDVENRASGVINVNTSSGGKSIGIYTDVPTAYVSNTKSDTGGLFTTTPGAIVGTETVINSGTINIAGNAGENSGTMTAGSGSITNSGTISVLGSKNYGMIQNSSEISEITSTGKVLVGNESLSNNSDHSIGFALLDGEGTNDGTISVYGDKSIGVYGEKGYFQNTGTIKVKSKTDTNYAIGVNLDGSSNTINFENENIIEAAGEKDVAVYIKGSKSTFEHNGTSGNIIASGKSTTGLYIKSSAIANIYSKITVGNGTDTSVGIINDGGIVSLGTSGVNTANLDIKNNSIGLHSTFNGGTLTINDLNATLGNNAVLAYYNTGSGTINITNANIDILEAKSTLVYADSGSVVSALDNANRTFTHQDLVLPNKYDDGAILYISNGNGTNLTVEGTGTITTNLEVAMAAQNMSKITNKKTLTLTGFTNNSSVSRTGDIGIYSSKSSIINEGTIETTGPVAIVGIFAENSSTVDNEGTIILNGSGGPSVNGDIGIYAKNSIIINSGKIDIIKYKSVGVYLKDSELTLSTSGVNDISFEKLGNYTENSMGFYLDGAKNLTINNPINFNSPNIKKNILIYAINKGTVLNNNIINIDGDPIGSSLPSGSNKTIGIYLEGISNNSNKYVAGINGKVNVINQAVGIYSDLYNEITIGEINASNKSTVGLYLDGAAKITGGIVKSDDYAVGVYGKGGKVEISAGLKLEMDTNGVGMYLSNGAYTTGDTITIKNNQISVYNVGVYYDPISSANHENKIILDSNSKEVIGLYIASGKSLTDKKDIEIDSINGIGAIAGDGSTFTSEGNINITSNDTIGEYTTAGEIINKGIITVGGTDSTGMAAIATSGKTSIADNKNTIKSGGNTGMYISNNSGISKGINTGTVETSTGTAVYVYQNNSTFDNTGGILNITGSKGIGFYLKDTPASSIIPGTIKSSIDGIGIYADNSIVDFDVTVNNTGAGGAIGVIGRNNTTISGNITVENKGVGLYVMDNSIVINQITITTGTKGTGIAFDKSVGVYSLTGVNVNAADGIGIYLEKDISPTSVNLTLNNSIITTSSGTALFVDENTKLTTNGVTLNVGSNSSTNIGVGIYIDNGGTADLGNGGLDTINFVTGGGIGIYNNHGTLTLGSNITQTGNGTIAAVVNGNFSYAGTASLTGSIALLGIYNSAMTGPNTIINNGNLVVNNGGIVMAGIKGTTTPNHPLTMTNTGTITALGKSISGQPSIALYTDIAEVINSGIINVGNDAIGIYTSSGMNITNNMINMTGTNGTGLYIEDNLGTLISNNITSTTPNNTGIVMENVTSGFLNNSTIILGNESVGILSKNSTATINGTFILGDGSVSKRYVGIIGESGSNLIVNPATTISTGDKGIGTYIDGTSSIDINGSSISVGVGGIHIYSNGGSVTLNGGNINADNNIGLIFDGGTFTNLGGTLNVINGGIGTYIKNNDVTTIPDNFISVQSGTANGYSIGILYDSVPSTVSIPLINQNGTDTIGAVLNNTDGFANNPISLTTGVNQVGIISLGVSDLTVNNNIGITGDNNTGVYSNSGSVSVNGNIIVGTSSFTKDMSLSSLGVYQNNGSYSGNGTITVGDNSIGIYGKNLLNNSTQNGNIQVGENAVGIYMTGQSGNENYQLTGDVSIGKNSFGVYNTNINTNFTGDVNVGNNNSIAIVSEGKGDINYNGIMTVGNGNSLGIFKEVKTGESSNITTSAANWTIGSGGYGIYVLESSGNKSGHINLNNNASMTLGTSALGIYANGNVNLTNNGNIIVGATDLGEIQHLIIVKQKNI